MDQDKIDRIVAALHAVVQLADDNIPPPDCYLNNQELAAADSIIAEAYAALENAGV